MSINIHIQTQTSNGLCAFYPVEPTMATPHWQRWRCRLPQPLLPSRRLSRKTAAAGAGAGRFQLQITAEIQQLLTGRNGMLTLDT